MFFIIKIKVRETKVDTQNVPNVPLALTEWVRVSGGRGVGRVHVQIHFNYSFCLCRCLRRAAKVLSAIRVVEYFRF